MPIDFSALMSLIQQAISFLEYHGLLYFIHAGIILTIAMWFISRYSGDE